MRRKSPGGTAFEPGEGEKDSPRGASSGEDRVGPVEGQPGDTRAAGRGRPQELSHASELDSWQSFVCVTDHTHDVNGVGSLQMAGRGPCATRPRHSTLTRTTGETRGEHAVQKPPFRDVKEKGFMPGLTVPPFYHTFTEQQGPRSTPTRVLWVPA